MHAESPFSIHTLELGPMENFIYLLVDRQTRRAAVVDPAWEPQTIIDKAEELGVEISDILLTHSHYDHINGIQTLLDRYDARLHLTHAESRFWGTELGRPALHHGGDVIQLGKTDIRVLLTPGHTPGSACYHLGNRLITGDTMFVYGCGRCDLAGGDPNQMYDTLRRLSRSLPGDTVTLPGHNYSTVPSCSLEQQIEGNPFLHFDDRERFVRFRMRLHDRHRHSPYAPVSRQEMARFDDAEEH